MENIKINWDTVSKTDTINAVLNVLSIGNFDRIKYTAEPFIDDIQLEIRFIEDFLEYYAIIIVNELRDFTQEKRDYELLISVPEAFDREVRNLQVSNELPETIEFKTKCISILSQKIAKVKEYKDIQSFMAKIPDKILGYLHEIRELEDRKGALDKINKFSQDSQNVENDEADKIARGCSLTFFVYETIINNRFKNVVEEIRKKLFKTRIKLNADENFMLLLIEMYKYWLISDAKHFLIPDDENSYGYCGKVTKDSKPFYRRGANEARDFFSLMLYMKYEGISTLPMFSTKEKAGLAEDDLIEIFTGNNVWYVPNNISDDNKNPEKEIIRAFYKLDPELEKMAGTKQNIRTFRNFIASAGSARRTSPRGEEVRQMMELYKKYSKKDFYEKLYNVFNEMCDEITNESPSEMDIILAGFSVEFGKSQIQLIKNSDVRHAIYMNRRFMDENSQIRSSVLIYNPNIIIEGSYDYKVVCLQALIMETVLSEQPHFTKECMQMTADIIMFILAQNFGLFAKEHLMRSEDYMTEISMLIAKILNGRHNIEELKENILTVQMIFDKAYDIYVDLLAKIGYNPKGRPEKVENGSEQRKSFDEIWKSVELKANVFGR